MKRRRIVIILLLLLLIVGILGIIWGNSSLVTSRTAPERDTPLMASLVPFT